MPQYSFCCRSEACASQFDTIQSMNAPFPPCPECNGETMRVITSAPAFSLKGGCWSGDGYSKSDTAAQNTADKAEKGQRIVSFPGQRAKGRTGA